MSESLTLMSLFTGSFLSATLLPGASEALLVTFMIGEKASLILLLLVATIGNSLGGVTNVILGRFFPNRGVSRWRERVLKALRRFGPALLLLSPLPVVGDLLCVLAGWLRMPWAPVLFFLCLGKLVRYAVVMGLTLQGLAIWQ